MTLFFLLNPKHSDPGVIVSGAFGGGAYKHAPSKSEAKEGEELKKKIDLSQYSDLLQQKLREFEETQSKVTELEARIQLLLEQQKLAVLLDAQERELLAKRIELAKLILLMQEEEQALLIMLVN